MEAAPASSGLLADSPKDLAHLGRLERLHEVSVEPGPAGALLVLEQAIAGESDEADGAALTIGADAPRDLVTIDAGETHVDERDVGLEPQHESDTGQAVRSVF